MKSPDLSEWIQRYFQEYLVRQRNVSPATVAAYRDTFRLLLHYWRQKQRQALATLSLAWISTGANRPNIGGSDG